MTLEQHRDEQQASIDSLQAEVAQQREFREQLHAKLASQKENLLHQQQQQQSMHQNPSTNSLSAWATPMSGPSPTSAAPTNNGRGDVAPSTDTGNHDSDSFFAQMNAAPTPAPGPTAAAPATLDFSDFETAPSPMASAPPASGSGNTTGAAKKDPMDMFF